MEDDPVLAHVRRWGRLPFRWGETDCCLVVADYLLEVTGIDCAAHLRGRYDSRESCEALCGWVSDPVAVVDDCLRRAGVARSPSALPRRGDAVLLSAGRHGTALGLMLEDKVALKAERGVLLAPVRPFALMGVWTP